MDDLDLFQLSPLRQPTAMIVDNFYADPDAVRKFALAQTFEAKPAFFQGQQSQGKFLFPGLKERFEQLLNMQITRWDDPLTRNGHFGLVVAGDKLVYHADETTHAAVIYLTPDAPPQAGSSLLRSTVTRGRTIEESVKLYGEDAAACTRLMFDGKLLDRTAWEEVDRLGNVYNRLVLWNGRMAHAASEYFGHNLETGRLFQIFFFG